MDNTTGQFGPLQFSLVTDKVLYSRGEAISQTFSVTNTGTQRIDYGERLPDLGETVSTGGKVVYDSSKIYGGGAGVFFYNLAPGADRVYRDFIPWDGKDQQGNSVPAGTYSILMWWSPGYIAVAGVQVPSSDYERLLAAKPVMITIQ